MKTNEKNSSKRKTEMRRVKKLTPQKTYKRYTQEQDELIIKKVKQFGRKWSKIVRFFPGKSRKMIRNRYLRIIAKQETEKIQDTSQLQTSENEVSLDLDSSEFISMYEYYKTQEQHIQKLINQTQEFILMQLIQQNYPHLYPYFQPSFQKNFTQKDVDRLVSQLIK